MSRDVRRRLVRSLKIEFGIKSDREVHFCVYRGCSPIVEIKLLRAYGGCLGASRRRRTRLAAISFGELLNELRSGDFRMGKPGTGNTVSSRDEFIVARSKRGEVKHLSTLRRRNQ